MAGANVAVVDSDDIELGVSTVTGTYTVTASGPITDSGTLEITGVATIAAGSSNNIELDYATNNFAAAVKISSGNDVEINDEDAIILGESTVSGTYKVTAGGAVTNTGALEISGVTTIEAGSGNNVTLDYSTNDFAGAVKISSANNVEITDESTIDLGDSTVSGTYDITATAGNITDSGSLNITGNSSYTTNTSGADITLNTTTNAFTGTVTVNTVGTGGDAEVHGGSTDLKIIASGEVGTLTLTTTGGADITDSGALVVLGATTIDSGTGNVTLDHGSSNMQGAVEVSGADVSLTHPVTIDLGDSTVTGTYDVTATTGNITDSGNLTITGLTTLVTSADGADIELNGTGHTFTGNVKVTTNETGTDADADATIDGGSSIGLKIERGSEVQGDLILKSGHANSITDEGSSGVVTVDGNLTATTYANNGSITLDNLAVDGTIGLNTHGTGNATAVNDVNFAFAASTVGGDLSATATTGNITQSGALTITGTTTLITSADNGTITLGTTTNAFTGALIITTNDSGTGTDGDVTIHGGTTALVLGDSTIDGDVTLTSTATGTTGITDTGTLNIRGTTTISASGIDVTLNSAANRFQGSIAIDGSDVVVVNANSTTDLAASTVTGTYTLTASGAVTDSGTLAITGDTTISAASSNVTLDTVTNNFQGAVAIDGVNVIVVDAGAIDLGASTVTGTYAVTATAGGDITDSGVLTITGESTFKAASGQNVTLDSTSTFSSDVNFTTASGNLANVTVTDTNDFEIQALTLSGNLDVISTGGSITDDGALAITGTSSFTTSASNEDITLDTTTNAFTGAVTLSTTGSTGNAEIDGGTTQLDIAASTVGGNLKLTSGNATGITDSGTVTVSGNLTAVNDVSNGDINMGSLAVDGTIALVTTGTEGDVTLVNDAGLNFATSSIGGDLTVTATSGNISDTGALTVTGATDITLGTTPIYTVTGVTSVTDLDGNTVNLDISTFTGGITINYYGYPEDNTDIDLARQVVFAEFIFGIYENRKNIYGGNEDINKNDIQKMYELFLKSSPKSKIEVKEAKKHLILEPKIRKINVGIIEQEKHKKL